MVHVCRQRAMEEQSAERRSLLGNADRSERVRTYNFQENRVTDHRIGVTLHGMEDMLAGSKLHQLTAQLHEHDQKVQITDMLQSGTFEL
jgi:peptide chain release factor 1